MGEHLVRALEGPEVGEGQHAVCVEDADDADVGEVEALCDHLGAYEDVEFAAGEGFDEAAVRVAAARCVGVHARDAGVREELGELLLDALGAESARAVVGAAAGGAMDVGRDAVAAVVALQFALCLVVGHGHVAPLAQGRVAAGAALPNGRIAPPVQEQDDLAPSGKGLFHRLAQERREVAFHGPPAALAQEV